PAGADEQAGGQYALRHRQQAHEGEPEHDEDEARELGSSRRREDAADRRRPGAENDEDDGEAEDERDARDDDAASGAALAEPAGLDVRERREIAGNERQ